MSSDSMLEMWAVRSMSCNFERLGATDNCACRWGAPLLLMLWGCGEGLPPVPGPDASRHDRCTGAPPQNVDASASEIQCLVDDYAFVINDDNGMPWISPALRAGRHAVILYADDVHRARGVAARWLEVMPAAVD